MRLESHTLLLFEANLTIFKPKSKSNNQTLFYYLEINSRLNTQKSTHAFVDK